MLNPLTAISHPGWDPVMLTLGPVQIHWYGVAYVIGILFAWWYAKKLASTHALWGANGSPMAAQQIDDFLVWAVAGIILGGRIGYILFYDLGTYIENPMQVFAIWQGGMSFHGGLAGVTLAMIAYAERHGFSPFHLFDVIAASCCIGIFLGRIANFINAELFGKVSNVPWAVIFPNTDGMPRHPSQLYEGVLEGLLLFIALSVLIWKYKKLHRPGFIAGAFIAGYALSRIAVEFVRLPDQQLGYFFGTDWITMGMLLSLPILMLGLWSIETSKKRTVDD